MSLGTQSGQVSQVKFFAPITCRVRIWCSSLPFLKQGFSKSLLEACLDYENFTASHYLHASDKMIVINMHFMFINLFINLLKQFSKKIPIKNLIEIKLLTNVVPKNYDCNAPCNAQQLV